MDAFRRRAARPASSRSRFPREPISGTVGSAAIAFTVAPSSNNVLSLTLGGVPSQIAVVPASSMSAQNAQGGIDLYGAGKHLLLVEMLDANQNVMVGGGGASFAIESSRRIALHSPSRKPRRSRRTCFT